MSFSLTQICLFPHIESYYNNFIIIIHPCGGRRKKQLNRCTIKTSITNSLRYSHSQNNGLTAPKLLFIRFSLNNKKDASLQLLTTWAKLVQHLQVIKIKIILVSVKELSSMLLTNKFAFS